MGRGGCLPTVALGASAWALLIAMVAACVGEWAWAAAWLLVGLVGGPLALAQLFHLGDHRNPDPDPGGGLDDLLDADDRRQP